MRSPRVRAKPFLPGQDPERPVDCGEVGGQIRAWVSADRPVDQFADQLSPGNTFCLRDPVQRSGLAFGEGRCSSVSYTTHTPLIYHHWPAVG
jgi:hypothetical protein